VCRRELPVIDAIAPEYLDDITILAVAGRSTPERSMARVGDWFSPRRLLWGYSDETWELYEVPYQPVSILISSDNVVVDRWLGRATETDLRAALDRLREIG